MNDIKRIILIACAAGIAFLLCLFIKNKIDSYSWQRAYKYNIAIPTEKADEFNYNVDSKQGLVITTGAFRTDNGVKFDELKNTYTYIEKVHESYEMHTRTVCTGSGENRTCRVEIYYSWDWQGSESKTATMINFFGRDYPAEKFRLGSFIKSVDTCTVTAAGTGAGFLETKKGCHASWNGGYYYTSDKDRYYYRAVPLTFTATFLTDTSTGNLENPFGGKIDLRDESIEKVKETANAYKIWNNLGLIFSATILLISTIILGYSWVMSDGEWSTKD